MSANPKKQAIAQSKKGGKTKIPISFYLSKNKKLSLQTIPEPCPHQSTVITILVK